jgi:beta-galactosidase
MRGSAMKARTRVSARAPAANAASAPRIAGCALTLGRNSLPLYAGAVHYFRLPTDAWRAALEGVKSLGCTMVETYVPWGVHELADGSYDFGQQDPSRDLGRFLDLAHSLGLHAFVRPGPNINAELTYFGLPRRIVFDPECQARSRRGSPMPFIAPPKMFAVPSYASERFLAEAERWFARVAEVVRPRVWPNGPVVLMQVDNEAAFYFRDAPYDQDHHPDTLAKHAAFLERRYEQLERLNAAYGTSYDSWQSVPQPERAPTTLETARAALDAMAFHAELLAGALERLRDALLHAFGDLPTVHNTPMGEAGLPTTLARLDRIVNVNGLDFYHLRTHLDHVRDRTLHMVGSVRCPFSPEMGMGAPPWFALRSNEDSLQTAVCAFAYGLRGLNLYMAVDRDRWYGAPFDERGRARDLAAPLSRLLAALHKTEFHALKRRVAIGLMIPKEYRELVRAMHTLGAFSPSLLALAGVGANAACHQADLGFAEPIALAYVRFIDDFARALEKARLPYVYVESDADDACLAELTTLISPSYEFTASERWVRLERFAACGGRVIYGPQMPRLDHALFPATFEPPLDSRLTDGSEADIELVVSELVRELDVQPRFSATQAVETTVHEDATGPRVVFVIQRGAQPVETELRLPEPLTLIDVLSEERFVGERSVRIPMEGASVRMLLCERGRASSRPPGDRRRPASARRNGAPC